MHRISVQHVAVKHISVKYMAVKCAHSLRCSEGVSEFIEARQTPSSIRDCRGQMRQLGMKKSQNKFLFSNLKTAGKIFPKASKSLSYNLYFVHVSTSSKVIFALVRISFEVQQVLISPCQVAKLPSGNFEFPPIVIFCWSRVNGSDLTLPGCQHQDQSFLVKQSEPFWSHRGAFRQ